jgi:hypothetical protein
VRPTPITIFISLLCLGAAPAASAADAPPVANPYQSIARRNVFGLRPSVAQKKTQTFAPLPSIVLTGITTILGHKRAFLEITVPSRPPQGSKPQPCALSEGQSEGEVEVLQIDPKAELVKVSNAGTEMTLTFEKNGRKALPSAAALPASAIRHFPFRTAAR